MLHDCFYGPNVIFLSDTEDEDDDVFASDDAMNHAKDEAQSPSKVGTPQLPHSFTRVFN